MGRTKRDSSTAQAERRWEERREIPRLRRPTLRRSEGREKPSACSARNDNIVMVASREKKKRPDGVGAFGTEQEAGREKK